MKYYPNENYIKSKRNKIYNETEQEIKKEEEEKMNLTKTESTSSPPNSTKTPTESKKSDISEKLNKKNNIMELPPDPSKGKSSNLAVQKKKQLSNLSTVEATEKPEILGKNGKKSSSAVSQIQEEKPEDNKKVTLPKNSNGNDTSNNETSDDSEENSKKNDTVSIKFNLNPQKFKFFEFHDNEEPSFIIDTFMNKLLISKKDDNNDSYVKVFILIKQIQK